MMLMYDTSSKIARINFLIFQERFIREGSLEVVEHDWRLTVCYGDSDWLIDGSVDQRGAGLVPGATSQTPAEPAGADRAAGEDQDQQDQAEHDEQDVAMLLEEVSAQHVLQPLLNTVSTLDVSTGMLDVLKDLDSLVVRILVVPPKHIDIIAVVHKSLKVLVV